MRKAENIAILGGKKCTDSRLCSLLLERGYKVFVSDEMLVDKNVLDKLTEKLRSCSSKK